jgi:hypothetical protein
MCLSFQIDLIHYSLMGTGISAIDLRHVELLDTSDVANRLGLSPSRVIQLEREGQIVAVRTASGRRVFLGSDVEVFRQSRRVANG